MGSNEDEFEEQHHLSPNHGGKSPERVLMVQKLSDGCLSSRNKTYANGNMEKEAGKKIYIHIEGGVAHKSDFLHERFVKELNPIASEVDIHVKRSWKATCCFVFVVFVIILLVILATVSLIRLLKHNTGETTSYPNITHLEVPNHGINGSNSHEIPYNSSAMYFNESTYTTAG